MAESLKSGVDLDCGYYYPDYLEKAVEEGLLSEDSIDKALVRLYSGLVRTGFFDTDNPYRDIGWKDVGVPEAQKLALEAAEEGIALLKNNGLLPLQIPQHREITIAAFGSWINATKEMQGNYEGIAQSVKSPLEALQDLENVKVVTPNWQRSKFEFVQTVKADIIIAVDGNRLEDAKETRDRNLLEWDETKEHVLSLKDLRIPIIVVNLGEQAEMARTCAKTPSMRCSGAATVARLVEKHSSTSSLAKRLRLGGCL